MPDDRPMEHVCPVADPKPVKGMLTGPITILQWSFVREDQSRFSEIIEAIAELDAHVISIEASRSDIELLDAFVDYEYPNEIGPGVYDIHSPRVPGVEEMMDRLRQMANVLTASQLWVNPDCGLKTRRWPEVKAALENMVIATQRLRDELKRQ